jgi:hypothetical protein
LGLESTLRHQGDGESDAGERKSIKKLLRLKLDKQGFINNFNGKYIFV